MSASHATRRRKMKRQEHMEWCKKRALEYVDIGDLPNAFASMTSDLRSYPETANHLGIELGMMLLFTGKLNTQDEMRKFIEGFN
jgi:hypothetical protein